MDQRTAEEVNKALRGAFDVVQLALLLVVFLGLWRVLDRIEQKQQAASEYYEKTDKRLVDLYKAIQQRAIENGIRKAEQDRREHANAKRSDGDPTSEAD